MTNLFRVVGQSQGNLGKGSRRAGKHGEKNFIGKWSYSHKMMKYIIMYNPTAAYSNNTVYLPPLGLLQNQAKEKVRKGLDLTICPP
jgi:hypothetical protein